jgi:MATE family multidrug resistance protein
MAATLAGASVLHDRRTRGVLRRGMAHVRWSSLHRLAKLGLPAALQLTLEVGVFATATALAARLDPVSLASHQIALNIASLVFMVPLGMASATAVLVGQNVGRGDLRGAGEAGWTSLAAIAVFMLGVAGLLLLAPHLLLVGFSRDPSVLALGSTLLAVAALFQLFDGWQAVATGALRGLGDTRTPMVLNLAGHWGLGLPVGWALCFTAQLGVVGLWVGLSVGLVFVGTTLILVWTHRVRSLVRR